MKAMATKSALGKAERSIVVMDLNVVGIRGDKVVCLCCQWSSALSMVSRLLSDGLREVIRPQRLRQRHHGSMVNQQQDSR